MSKSMAKKDQAAVVEPPMAVVEPPMAVEEPQMAGTAVAEAEPVQAPPSVNDDPQLAWDAKRGMAMEQKRRRQQRIEGFDVDDDD